MSLQASWNSALGILGGIGQMKKQADIAEYNAILAAKAKTDAEIQEGTAEWEKIRSSLPENTPIEEVQKLGKEHAMNRRDRFDNKIGYDYAPRSIRKQYDRAKEESTIGALESLGDEAQFMRNVLDVQRRYGMTNQQAAQRAQEHISRSDTARNSGAEVVRSINNRPDIRFNLTGDLTEGGERNG